MSPILSRKPLALIVDDNPANLGVLVKLLTRQDVEVSIAEDGESALEQAEDVRPDLILLDVMMPEMDGFTTCRLLKERPATRDIPIIFMTALSATGLSDTSPTSEHLAQPPRPGTGLSRGG